MVVGGVQMMKSDTQKHATLLVDQLSCALAGTNGRVVHIDSVRTLVALEVADWKHKTNQQASSGHSTDALIAGPSELFC
jgi:hypothetical protein